MFIKTKIIFQISKAVKHRSLSVGDSQINKSQRTQVTNVLSKSSNVLSSIANNSEEELTNTSTSYKNDKYNVAYTQGERQRQLRNYCKQNRPVKPKHPKVENVYYSDKQAVIYCSVPKVACTNWKRMLQVFEGNFHDPLDISDKQSVHTLKYSYLLRLSPEEIQWKKNVYYSFMFVRHPFERLLSAYRNKLRDPYNSIFQRRYGSQILKRYRKGLSQEEYAKGENVTFQEFVDYLILLHDNYSDKKFDEHWQVMHTLCTPCKMKYNFIGKMETLVEDANYILKQLGVENLFKFPSNTTDKYKQKTNNLMKEYYSKLPASTVQKLYEIYKEDFLSFGYEIPDFS